MKIFSKLVVVSFGVVLFIFGFGVGWAALVKTKDAVSSVIVATDDTAIDQTLPTGATPSPREASVSEMDVDTPKMGGGFLVSRVIDGDTVELETGETVRYIGVDTPETNHPQKGVECFGQEATQANRELVEGKGVTLVKDISETDRYGRLLRYVYVEDIMVNEYLVQYGFAHSSAYPPDVKYQERFDYLETQARTNSVGLWSENACDDDGMASKFAVVPSPTGACQIKGNISYTSGEKIYHVPGCPYYDTTSINETKGEKYFCDESEAVRAGWRKAVNCK